MEWVFKPGGNDGVTVKIRTQKKHSKQWTMRVNEMYLGTEYGGVVHDESSVNIPSVTMAKEAAKIMDKLGVELLHSSPRDFNHLIAFWSKVDDERLIHFLEKINFAYLPLLVQYWALVDCEGSRYLAAKDQPFAIGGHTLDGLCSYRKTCMGYRYNVDEQKISGPLVRVFKSQSVEYCPSLELYTKDEFPLRKAAIDYAIGGYMAMPVLETHGGFLGVLEFLCTTGETYFLPDKAKIVSGLLQEVGLRSQQFLEVVEIARHEPKLGRITALLDLICPKLNIPLAQTWMMTGSGGRGMVTPNEGSYVLRNNSAVVFREDCIQLPLGQGQVVVGMASSRGLGFCEDVTKLTLSQYPLAPSSRKAGLRASFAIRVRDTDDNDEYVLEFLIKQYTQGWPKFLSSIVHAVKMHLSGFKVADLEELGYMSVENIKNSTLRGAGPIIFLQELPAKDGGQKAVVGSAPVQAKILDKTPISVKLVYNGDTMMFDLYRSSGITDLKNEVRMRLERHGGGVRDFHIKYENKSKQQITIESDIALQGYLKSTPEGTAHRFYAEPVTT